MTHGFETQFAIALAGEGAVHLNLPHSIDHRPGFQRLLAAMCYCLVQESMIQTLALDNDLHGVEEIVEAIFLLLDGAPSTSYPIWKSTFPRWRSEFDTALTKYVQQNECWRKLKVHITSPCANEIVVLSDELVNAIDSGARCIEQIELLPTTVFHLDSRNRAEFLAAMNHKRRVTAPIFALVFDQELELASGTSPR